MHPSDRQERQRDAEKKAVGGLCRRGSAGACGRLSCCCKAPQGATRAHRGRVRGAGLSHLIESTRGTPALPPGGRLRKTPSKMNCCAGAGGCTGSEGAAFCTPGTSPGCMWRPAAAIFSCELGGASRRELEHPTEQFSSVCNSNNVANSVCELLLRNAGSSEPLSASGFVAA